MGTTFPKDIMDCMKGCILSIFWPKKDIVDFMKKVGCTSRELMPESEYKELHRAEIVDKIFTNLEKTSDPGIGQFRCLIWNMERNQKNDHGNDRDQKWIEYCQF